MISPKRANEEVLSMAITTTCPGCTAIFRLPDELAGKTVRCQKCERMFVVPLPTVGQGLAIARETEVDAPHEIVEEVVPIRDEADAPPPIEAPVAETTQGEPVIEGKPNAPLATAPTPIVPVPIGNGPEQSPSRFWAVVSLALFLFGVGATGAFAAIWVATHVTSPQVVLVPSLKAAHRMPVPIRGGKDFIPIFDGKKIWFKDGNVEGRTDNRKRLVRYLVVWNEQGRYEETHLLTANDPLELSAPGRGPYKEYYVDMFKGQKYRIEMKSHFSTPMVIVSDAQGMQLAHQTGINGVSIDFTPDQSASYRIRAIAGRPSSFGQYSIKIVELP